MAHGYFRGTAQGGPLDGYDIGVQGDDEMAVRGIVVHVLIGEDQSEALAAGWGTYGFVQVPNPEGSDGGFFEYLGTVERPNYPAAWWEQWKLRQAGGPPQPGAAPPPPG